MSADYLSDEEAEAMDRARDPDWWERSDYWLVTLEDSAPELRRRSALVAAIRCAWSARPATARALDEAARHATDNRSREHGIGNADTIRLQLAALNRGRHLIATPETAQEEER